MIGAAIVIGLYAGLILLCHWGLERDERRTFERPDYLRIYELEVELGMRERLQSYQVAAFQREVGLAADGYLGPQTLTALIARPGWLPDEDLCPCGYGDECAVWCGNGHVDVYGQPAACPTKHNASSDPCVCYEPQVIEIQTYQSQEPVKRLCSTCGRTIHDDTTALTCQCSQGPKSSYINRRGNRVCGTCYNSVRYTQRQSGTGGSGPQ